MPYFMKTLVAGAATLSLQAAASPSPRVVKMPIGQKSNSNLLVKRDPFAISLQNYIPYGEYFVTASIGTPAQDIELIVDTGSSDIWVFGTGSCAAGSPCEGGQFDRSQSSTLQAVPNGQGAFQIQYQTPGSGVVGDYVTDVFSVGGVNVTDLTLAIATRARQVPSGIMGIGLSVNEAAVSQGLGRYPNFPDLLVRQGKIGSKAYSLYLDDITTSTGALLFGGYDYDKFMGNLTMLPIQLDDQSGMRTSFTVSWTSIGLNMPKGDEALEMPGFVYGAVLDTGTTLTYMPSELYQPLANFFNVTESAQSQGLSLVDCDIGKTKGQLIYGLGGDDGVQIAVEFDELAVPIYSTRTGKQLTLRNGQPACQFGLSDAGAGFSILFGQTFLRSAYVLYDLDNLQLGIAQTVFDANSSNIMEYNGNATDGRIVDDNSEPTVTYAVQESSLAPGYGGYGGFGSFTLGESATGGLDGQATGGVSVVTTSYSLTNFHYPSNELPTAFPTELSAGSTGRIDAAGNSGSGSERSGGSGSGTNHAGSISPVFATAGALMLAIFTTMLML